MITYFVAVKDLGAQAFMRAAPVPHTNTAVRSFMDEVNRKPADGQTNDLYTHSQDFELYLVGEFDDSTGTFSNNKELPKLLSRGVEVKNA